jgi:hypothetical protein
MRKILGWLLKLLFLPIWLPFWVILILPGKCLLWLQYYFPQSAKDVVSSRRKKGKVIFEILGSIVFWGVLGFLYLNYVQERPVYVAQQKSLGQPVEPPIPVGVQNAVSKFAHQF